MENGQDLFAFRTQCAKSHADLLDRRLKNRERQRRYRARKRLEADSKKACTLKRSTPQQVEVQLSGVPENFTAKVYCKRNWKKDARNAHALMKSEAVSDRPLVSSLTSVSQSQTPSLLSEAKAEQPSLQKNHSENFFRSVCAAKKYVPNRRNWKAEARKRKI